MASIRSFKKEVNYTLGAVLDECMYFMILGPEKNDDELSSIAEDVATYYDELLKQINVRAEDRAGHLKNVRNDFNQKVEGFVKRLEALN